jgi:hypothetical protein
MFTGRRGSGRGITTRQYARLDSEWIASIGLDPHLFGTHSLRRTNRPLHLLREAPKPEVSKKQRPQSRTLPYPIDRLTFLRLGRYVRLSSYAPRAFCAQSSTPDPFVDRLFKRAAPCVPAFLLTDLSPKRLNCVAIERPCNERKQAIRCDSDLCAVPCQPNFCAKLGGTVNTESLIKLSCEIGHGGQLYAKLICDSLAFTAATGSVSWRNCSAAYGRRTQG